MTQVNKPWGYYKDLHRSPDGDVVLKMICVDPGEEISYQFHKKRTEMWYVISGKGKFIKNGVNRLVFPDDYVTIAPTAKHQVVNTGTEPLCIYEMQCGECSEDDIVRLEDKYER